MRYEPFRCYYCGLTKDDEGKGKYTINGNRQCWDCRIAEIKNKKMGKVEEIIDRFELLDFD